VTKVVNADLREVSRSHQLSSEICVDGRPVARNVAAEHDASGRHPDFRQIQPEDVRIILVVGVPRETTVESWDGGQRPNHQAP
jgi:hypothetical protein